MGNLALLFVYRNFQSVADKPANFKNFCASGGNVAVPAETDITESSRVITVGCAPTVESDCDPVGAAGDAGAIISAFKWAS